MEKAPIDGSMYTPPKYDRLEALLKFFEDGGGAPIVISHNKGVVLLQFVGFSVNLYEDGTWIVEDTTGG